ncbi:hypothetical protein [Microlunatus speluncae]|uniref:hypothetical protein n=1 Tax=Microlunatus speluncae TaxID=2594267 RepID=UPI0015832B04|nr:hypothetical protein [Microlunatus speluncae]
MRIATRTVLLILGVGQGLGALAQLFAPRWFFDDGPWVSGLPPYNEHLMRDVGAATLGWVLLIFVAALTLRPFLVRLAVLANLLFTVPHFVFHASHLEGYSGAEAVAQLITFGLGILLPLIALALHERSVQPAPQPA